MVWAAIDCSGAYAVGGPGRGEVVLGRMAAEIHRLPEEGEQCVVVAWPLGEDGRKLYAGTALLGGGRRAARGRPPDLDSAPKPVADGKICGFIPIPADGRRGEVLGDPDPRKGDAMATMEKGAVYEAPGREGSVVELKARYENFIGGHWVAPMAGEYSTNVTPATGEPFTEVPRSTAEDIELALDAAHAAKEAWGETSTTERSRVLNKVADAIEENLELLAVAESWENGKPVRETLAADIPLAADHFRYFASVIRGEEGAISEIDKNTVAYHFKEPLGVVGQIIPFNFPLLMAAWKLAPALAAGNAVVLKPASPTPWSILKLMELIEEIVPAGVINVVNGPGAEIGKALATNKRIAKIAFTGETVTGRLIMQYAAQNIIPSTTELGGKSPNIFFADVMAADDAFLDKASRGSCSTPSTRARSARARRGL